MRSTRPRPTLAPAYRKALNTWRPVILYFGNTHCPACEIAEPIFRQVAEQYRDRASIYVLITGESPRHPNVTGTPTVLFYMGWKLLKKLKGIGTRQTLEADFAAHIGKTKPKLPHRQPTHTVHWLRQTLRTLRTAPRAHDLLNRRLHTRC
jgi:thioredoxin 1